MISNTVNIIVANNNLYNLLKGGVNSIKIEGGTKVGSYTTGNNLRGIAVRDGNNILGFVASFNCSEAYIISCDSGGIWNHARKI